jgi:hypothetical protein
LGAFFELAIAIGDSVQQPSSARKTLVIAMVYGRRSSAIFRPLGTAILLRALRFALRKIVSALRPLFRLSFRFSWANFSETLREVYADSACALCNEE